MPMLAFLDISQYNKSKLILIHKGAALEYRLISPAKDKTRSGEY